MRIKLTVFILIASMLLLVGCDSKTENNRGNSNTNQIGKGEVEVIKITTPNAPNSIPLFYMKENNVLGDSIQLDIGIHKSGEEAVAKTIKGEIDMANFGVQEAANLYNEGVKIRLMDVSTWATFEMLTVREDIRNWSDLKGKKLWIGDKGGPMDYLTQIVTRANDIDIEGELEVNRASAVELAQMAVSNMNNIDVFVLREPFISQVKVKNNEIKTAFDLGEAYETAFQIKIPQGGTVIREAFLSEKKELVLKFQEEYKEAIKWINGNPVEAGELGAKYMEGANATILASAIENMEMDFYAIEDSQEILESYFNKAMEIDETMLEGELPNGKFYKGIFE